jgi:predicted enzyme related to lactoylglutathione lyase
MNQSEHDRRLDYIEFSTRNVAVAREFYSAVFGWTFTDYGADYTSFADGRMNGGFTKKDRPSTAMNPLVVIYSKQLERTQSRVLAHGGRVTMATHDFPGGRRFHFADPTGLELAVWSDLHADGTKIA